MFESISSAPIDPILGLTELFHSDKRKNKINLGIGVYQDEKGNTPIFKIVKKVENLLLKKEITKNYLNIDGLNNFNLSTQKLLFGKKNSLISEERVKTAQTPGGTSALHIAADFISSETPIKRVWISYPSWPNHKNIFNSRKLEVCYYNYYDQKHHKLDFDKMIHSLKKVKSGDLILFHGCCHNPTGVDPTPEQWKELALLSQKNGWLPLFDFAYQGFSKGIKQDAEGLRIFSSSNQEMLVANSYSKNFSLYNERVGSISIIAETPKITNRSFSQIKHKIRANYSNPPAHGAKIVMTILQDPSLKNLWEKELTKIRERIQKNRKNLTYALKKKNTNIDFSFIEHQTGMFSFSGLTEKQVLKLRKKFGIYLVESGRINIAGISTQSIPIISEAINSVL